MIELLPEALAGCRRCPRLVAHRELVAQRRRRAYLDQEYWGRPVPGIGDPAARVLLLGLAPGAHGANRTGRMFTGDASGAFLYPALWRAGFASKQHSHGRDDDLRLRDLWITGAARCAPPDNRPLRVELGECRTWLAYDMDHLPRLRLVVALGAIAHDAYLELLKLRGLPLTKAHYPFAHGALHRFAGTASPPPLLDCYHVSQQNTLTGRLTPEMLDEVLARARELSGLGG